MEEVANIALEGRAALTEKNYEELARLMNRNFDLRRSDCRLSYSPSLASGTPILLLIGGSVLDTGAAIWIFAGRCSGTTFSDR